MSAGGAKRADEIGVSHEDVLTAKYDLTVRIGGEDRVVTATIRIDVAGLVRDLGARAVRAQHGRATLAAGLVRVTVPR